ncbi:MAG: hypothetical protein L0Y79_03935, partial [Chlorobi bacterium]|nr:hypothetical protein [Chlorobiota bacterium]
MTYKTIIFITAFLIIGESSSFSQFPENKLKLLDKPIAEKKLTFADSLSKGLKRSKSISAVFLSVGGGISVPLSPFKTSSDVTFGILGRIEFSSYGIFPFVVGGEITYFSYAGADEFKTINLLTNFKTTMLSYGLNIEYSLAKILRSSFTMPFLAVDVKYNNIKREYDESRNFTDLPKEESKISVGAGFGFTLFIFDFYTKYNYM